MGAVAAWCDCRRREGCCLDGGSGAAEIGKRLPLDGLVADCLTIIIGGNGHATARFDKSFEFAGGSDGCVLERDGYPDRRARGAGDGDAAFFDPRGDLWPIDATP